MKIIYEDRAIEEAVSDGEMCIAVPIEIAVFENSEPTVTAYPSFKKQAEEYRERFESAPLCKEAVFFVKESLSAKMDKLGYEPDDGEGGHLLYFFADENTVVNKRMTDASMVMISRTSDFEKYICPEELFPEVDDEDEADVYFVAVCEGRIVAFAGVNDITADGALEINVETDADFRNKGYGSAVAAELICYLVSLGERVAYCCNYSNIASQKLAKSIGLKFEKEVYSFVYYHES